MDVALLQLHAQVVHCPPVEVDALTTHLLDHTATSSSIIAPTHMHSPIMMVSGVIYIYDNEILIVCSRCERRNSGQPCRHDLCHGISHSHLMPRNNFSPLNLSLSPLEKFSLLLFKVLLLYSVIKEEHERRTVSFFELNINTMLCFWSIWLIEYIYVELYTHDAIKRATYAINQVNAKSMLCCPSRYVHTWNYWQQTPCRWERRMTLWRARFALKLIERKVVESDLDPLRD